MVNLRSRASDTLDSLTGRELSIGRRRIPARIQRAIDEEEAIAYGRGIVQATRVRAVEHVARRSMQAVAGLSQMEALYLCRAPLGEARYRTLVDTTTVTLADIIAETGWQW